MYSIVVWHKNCTEGSHQSGLFAAKTIGKILRDFERELNLPEQMRSFNKHNLIQLHHTERGVIASFPASLRDKR